MTYKHTKSVFQLRGFSMAVSTWRFQHGGFAILQYCGKRRNPDLSPGRRIVVKRFTFRRASSLYDYTRNSHLIHRSQWQHLQLWPLILETPQLGPGPYGLSCMRATRSAASTYRPRRQHYTALVPAWRGIRQSMQKFWYSISPVKCCKRCWLLTRDMCISQTNSFVQNRNVVAWQCYSVISRLKLLWTYCF